MIALSLHEESVFDEFWIPTMGLYLRAGGGRTQPDTEPNRPSPSTLGIWEENDMGSYLFFPEAPLLENHLAYRASDPENTFRVSVSTAS